jgi:hypothetical protein
MGVFGGGVFGAGIFGGLTSLSLVVQTIYPDRVLLTVTGLVDGQVYSITRRVAGSTERVPVRGASEVVVTSDAAVKVDAEAPYGEELTYTLTVDGVDLESELITLTLSGGHVALSDAISGNAAEVVIYAWPEKRRERASSVFAVGGRNIVVSGQRGGFSGQIDSFVETDDSKNQVLNLLQNATSGIIQIRRPAPIYDGVDCYVSVQSDAEVRWSADGSDPRRIISLDVVETRPWAPALESSTFTYQDVADFYTGLTYADWSADYATYLDAAVGDYS